MAAEAGSQEAKQVETAGEAEEETANEAAVGFDFVDECTDKYGNVTLYALTELKGWQLETLLDQQGYRWDESQYGWIRASDGANYSAWKETGESGDRLRRKSCQVRTRELDGVLVHQKPLSTPAAVQFTIGTAPRSE